MFIYKLKDSFINICEQCTKENVFKGASTSTVMEDEDAFLESFDFPSSYHRPLDDAEDDESVYEDDDMEDFEEEFYEYENDEEDDELDADEDVEDECLVEEEGNETEDSSMANAIMKSIESGLGQESPMMIPKGPIKMTDLGFKISQMVLMKQSSNEVAEEEKKDALLERTIEGRRRNRTGVRGRPKKEDDDGFGRSTTVKLTPEVAKLMGKANMSYVQRNYDEAIECLQEVIKKAPSSPEPYHTLGLIHEERGEYARAFSYYLLSAHLTKADVELWSKLTQLAISIGRPREIVYCLGKFLQIGKIYDPRPYWIRARLFLELQSYGNVIMGFLPMLRKHFGDIDQFQTVARLALRLNLSYDAARLFFKLFEEACSAQKNRVNEFGWSHLNLLLEMYLASKNYEGLIQAVELFSPTIYSHWNRKGLMPDLFLYGPPQFDQVIVESLPIDIKVRYAAALIYNNRGDKQSQMIPWDLDSLVHTLDANEYGDMRILMGDAYLEMKKYDMALFAFIPLIGTVQYGNGSTFLKISKCQRSLSQAEEALNTLTMALTLEPENRSVKIALADLYRESFGRSDLAANLIDGLSDKAGEDEVKLIDLDAGNLFAQVYPGITDAASLLLDGNKMVITDEGGDIMSNILQLPNVGSKRRHPLLRQVRRRRRKMAQVRYDEGACNRVQGDYKQAKIFFDLILADNDDYNSLTQFLQIVTPLIEDDLTTNNHLRSDEKYRKLAPEVLVDLAALHGLYVEEWFDMLRMYCVVLGRAAGAPEQGLKVLRLFLFQSAFAHESEMILQLRLIQYGLAMLAGKYVGALIGSRWFLTQFKATFGPLLLHSWTGFHHPQSVCSPFNSRPLSRFARLDQSRQNISVQLMCAHAWFGRACYQEAAKLYTLCLDHLSSFGDSSLGDSLELGKARLRHFLACCWLEASGKRTCLEPKLLILQAFSLLALNHRLEGEEVRYNLARFCHQAGLISRAESLYRSVIGAGQPSGKFSRLASYNLHLIYLQNGNALLAQQTLSTITI